MKTAWLRAAKPAAISPTFLRLKASGFNHPRWGHLLGKRRKLVGGTVKIELLREDLNRVLVEGFFPKVGGDEMPARQRRIGFQELGLPYAADAAITKHLGRFLSQQVQNSPEGSNIRRGRSGLACRRMFCSMAGVMKAEVLRGRLVEVLNSWLAEEGVEVLGPANVLDGPDLEHAVARGAAYYGRARRGEGVRIRSGASRTYYVGIESAMPAVPGMEAPLKALCVVPFGMEEGTEALVPESLPIRARTVEETCTVPGKSQTGAEQQLGRELHASRGSGPEELDTHRQSTGRTQGCGNSLGRGKLPPVETPSARLFGRGSPRVCRSPGPAPPRPYSCCVGRPAFIDSSDEVINKGVLRQQPYRFLFVGGYESGVVA